MEAVLHCVVGGVIPITGPGSVHQRTYGLTLTDRGLSWDIVLQPRNGRFLKLYRKI